MEESIVAAYFLSPFQGDYNFSGRHKTHASTGFQSPFCCRPEKWVEKGDWKPYSYWPLVALPYTTSYRRSAFIGRQPSGRKSKKCVNTKTCVGRRHQSFIKKDSQ